MIFAGSRYSRAEEMRFARRGSNQHPISAFWRWSPMPRARGRRDRARLLVVLIGNDVPTARLVEIVLAM